MQASHCAMRRRRLTTCRPRCILSTLICRSVCTVQGLHSVHSCHLLPWAASRWNRCGTNHPAARTRTPRGSAGAGRQQRRRSGAVVQQHSEAAPSGKPTVTRLNAAAASAKVEAWLGSEAGFCCGANRTVLCGTRHTGAVLQPPPRLTPAGRTRGHGTSGGASGSCAIIARYLTAPPRGQLPPAHALCALVARLGALATAVQD